MRARSLAWVMLPIVLGGCPLGPAGGGECSVDRDCSGSEVCARDGACASPSSVRDVKATWTVRGMPATAESCAGHPDLYITFEGNPGESLGFSPVPCLNGLFTVTKLPRTYTRVELGIRHGTSDFASIDASGAALLDLFL
jgi:hypothetical protein